MTHQIVEDVIRQTNILLDEARNFFSMSDLDQSEECVNQALRLLLTFSNREDLGGLLDDTSLIYNVIANIAHAYNRLNIIYDSRGEFQKAIEHGTTAIHYCELINLKWRIGNLYGNLGGTHLNLGDYSQSLEYLNKALANAEEIGDEKIVATWLINIGIVYGNLGDIEQSLEKFSLAQRIAKKISDQDLEASSELSIGQSYSKLGKHELALEYYNKALAYFRTKKLKQDVAITLMNIGIIYQQTEDYELALKFMKESLSINEEIQAKAYIANCRGNIGTLYTELGEYSQAGEYLRIALSQAIALGDKRQQAHWIYALGMAYSNINNDSSAEGERNLKEAVVLAKNLGLLELESQCREGLSDLFAGQKRWEESANEFRGFHELDKKVQNEEAVNKAQLMENRRKIDEAERDRQLKIARHETTVALLHKTLPPSIAERMMNGEHSIVDSFESVSILFADIVGFTKLSARIEPKKLVEILNDLFSRFDHLTGEFGVERIKTIGDSYMIVAGAPERCEDHAARIARVALAMLEVIEEFNKDSSDTISIRIGINCGRVIGAVIGETKFAYDFWSDAVNTASRMESHGEPGRIHVSREFAFHLQNIMDTTNDDLSGVSFVERDEIDIKGKGMMKTYFMERI